MSDATVARLKFDLTASTGGLRSGMAQAASIVKGSVGSMGADLTRLGGFRALGGVAGRLGLSVPDEMTSLMGGLGKPMMGLGIAGGLYGTMQAFASRAKEMEHASARMGVDVEQYQELSRASRLTGTTLQETAGGMRRMQRSIFEANKGGLAMSSTFQRLGLNVRQINAMEPGQQIEAIAKGLSKISDTTTRRGFEAQIFGRGGASLDPMLMQMSRGGLGEFKRSYDLTPYDTKLLSEQKNMFQKEIPGVFMKSAAWATSQMRAVGTELVNIFLNPRAKLTGWQEEEINAAIEKAKGKRGSGAVANEPIRQLGGLAMYGSQAAYQATTAWKFTIEEKQLAVLESIDGHLGEIAGEGGDIGY